MAGTVHFQSVLNVFKLSQKDPSLMRCYEQQMHVRRVDRKISLRSRWSCVHSFDVMFDVTVQTIRKKGS